MTVEQRDSFTVGDWIVEPSLDRLRDGERKVGVQPQVMNLLTCLAHRAGEVVSPEELMSCVWPGRVVTQSSIYVALNHLREALGDDAHEPRYIQTVPKRGYRLIAPVALTEDGGGCPNERPERNDSAISGSFVRIAGVLLAVLAIVLFVHWPVDESAQPQMVGETRELPTRSVAVLPFEDLSPDQNQRWFAEGIAEEILNQLVQVPNLKVSGRTSSFSSMFDRSNPKGIGAALGVAHLLEGSVRKDGDTLRVTAQLIRVDDGFHVWSETFDRNQKEIFRIQRDIAVAVSNALQVQLSDASRFQQTDPEIYALFLEGRFMEKLDGRENRFKAFSNYQRVVARDPRFAPAWVGLARQYTFRGPFQDLPWEIQYQLTIDALEHALDANPELAEAWAMLGWVRVTYDWEWDSAREAIEESRRLSPNDPEHLGAAATLAWVLNQSREQLLLRERLVELDPMRLSSLVGLGLLYERLDRTDDALEVLNRVEAVNPDYPLLRMHFGRVFLKQGKVREALDEFEKYPPSGRNIMNLIEAYDRLGRSESLRAVIDGVFASSAEEDPYWLATLSAWLGNNDEAFFWLDQAREQRRFRLARILTNPHLKNLEGDSRYPAFLESLNLLEAWLALEDDTKLLLKTQAISQSDAKYLEQRRQEDFR